MSAPNDPSIIQAAARSRFWVILLDTPGEHDRMVEWSDQLRQKFNLKSETKLDEYWSGYRDCVDDLDRFLMKMHEEEIQQNADVHGPRP